MAETIDTALELLQGYGPEFRRLSNHGPMAAEALLRLGRGEVVVGWVERYRERLDRRPSPREPVDRRHWRPALGDFERVADWRQLFDEALTEDGWRSTLSQWVPRLAPGLAAAGFHGLIRTAHAARSLSDSETDLRLGELAEGLAFWAARYQEMPGVPSEARSGSATPPLALLDVPFLPEERRVNGLISDELASLNGFTPFLPVVDLIAIPDPVRTISGITATFARVFIANMDSAAFSFIHSVTGPSALRMLLPFLEEADARTAVRYAWQAAAGIYAAVGHTPSIGFEPQIIDDDELIDRAVATRDEHAIKFTEACLREERIHPDPAFRESAGRLSASLGTPPA
jgi:hypothetical protein